MGAKPSKPVQSIQSCKQVTPVSKRAANINETEQIEKMCENIQKVIDDMKKDVKANSLIPDKIFDSLFIALESLREVMNPARSNVCWVVGPSNTGKSSIINKICEKDICQVSEDDSPGTVEFKEASAPQANAVFIDTMGFGSNVKGNNNLVSKMKSASAEYGRPDAMILVVSKDALRNERHLKLVIDDFNRVLNWMKKRYYNVETPIICVLSKIDDYVENKLPNSEADIQQIAEYAKRALTKVNKYLMFPATQCISVSARHNYGIDQLRDNINAQSPLNAQITDNDLNHVTRARLSIANKIIAAFSTATAAVSFLPFADVIIVTILQEWMYRMLACFSVDPTRTADTFKALHCAQQNANLGVRLAALTIGGVFKASVIGYLVGSAICVTMNSISTATIGWACYHYFVQ